jgi:hypothetical protein
MYEYLIQTYKHHNDGASVTFLEQKKKALLANHNPDKPASIHYYFLLLNLRLRTLKFTFLHDALVFRNLTKSRNSDSSLETFSSEKDEDIFKLFSDLHNIMKDKLGVKEVFSTSVIGNNNNPNQLVKMGDHVMQEEVEDFCFTFENVIFHFSQSKKRIIIPIMNRR